MSLRSKHPIIIDSHCHIYPGKIAHKAVESIDRFYDGVPTSCLYDGTPETLLKIGKEEGISHFIVHSVATRPAQVQSINEFIADSVQRAGGAFTGLGTMHPDSTDPKGDLDHLCELGLKGIKLHPDFQKFHADDARAFRIYEMAMEKGLPVLVHTGDFRFDYSNPNRVAKVLETLPELKFIGAHLGGWSVWDDALRLLPQYPNIIVDSSSSLFYLQPERAREIIRAFGAERVMFGTDYPMWHWHTELEAMEKLQLTDEEYQCIFWKNCAKLYDIPVSETCGLE